MGESLWDRPRQDQDAGFGSSSLSMGIVSAGDVNHLVRSHNDALRSGQVDYVEV